jgi:hypothetical protein
MMTQLFREPTGALRLCAILPDNDVFAGFRFDIRRGHAGHGNFTFVNVNPAFACFGCEFFDAIHTVALPFCGRFLRLFLFRKLSAKNSYIPHNARVPRALVC